MSTKKIIAATGNKGKLKEIQEILSDYEVISMKDLGINSDVEENGKTFRDNAYIKAKAIADITKYPVLSDDSGLLVDALGGNPGVHTARFAGENATDDENINKLLYELKDVPENMRSARFVSVICIIMPDGNTIYGEGVCEGTILFEKKGENGFGYDPIFFVPKYSKTFAELSACEKNTISHRRKALDDVNKKLTEIF